MKLLDIDYLNKLEDKLAQLNKDSMIFESIGGGSTLFFIGIFIILFVIITSIVIHMGFLNYMKNLKSSIKSSNYNLKLLKDYVSKFNSSLSLNNKDINNDKEYLRLLDNYKSSKVSFIKKLFYFIMLPLFILINSLYFIEDYTNEFLSIISFALSVLLVIVGIIIGTINVTKEYVNRLDIIEREFVIEDIGTPVKYPILHYKKQHNFYEVFYLSDNTIKSVNYDGVIHMDSNLVIDNSVLDDKILFIDTNIDIDTSVLYKKNILGYLEIHSYSSFINEYNEFKKENKEFLENSTFYNDIEDLIYDLKNNTEISNVYLKNS